MSKEFYYNDLYPFQDLILKYFDELGTEFYLTGGTAVNRIFTFHRYSDDLDFFVNQSPNFSSECKKIIDYLSTKEDLDIIVALNDEFFVRIMVQKQGVSLKVEFINDVGYHRGEFLTSSIYSKTDNPLNILSNKLTALSRTAPKDISDIVFLSRNYAFNWIDIVNDAKRKDAWVNEIYMAQYMDKITISHLEEVNWIETPSFSDIMRDIQIIKKDLLLGTKNSLFLP